MSKRVVIAEQDGKSVINPDYEHPRAEDYEHTPGFATSIIWSTQAGNAPAAHGEDPALAVKTLHPDPGGTVFMLLTLPPDEIYFSDNFDFAAAGAEQAEKSVGIADRMEPDAPGFHRTQTVDYVIVLDGEVVLESDTGEVTLERGDIVVQNGTRHAWRNRTHATTTLAVVLMGTE